MKPVEVYSKSSKVISINIENIYTEFEPRELKCNIYNERNFVQFFAEIFYRRRRLSVRMEN
jgi:hypothetical protein